MLNVNIKICMRTRRKCRFSSARRFLPKMAAAICYDAAATHVSLCYSSPAYQIEYLLCFWKRSIIGGQSSTQQRKIEILGNMRCLPGMVVVR